MSDLTLEDVRKLMRDRFPSKTIEVDGQIIPDINDPQTVYNSILLEVFNAATTANAEVVKLRAETKASAERFKRQQDAIIQAIRTLVAPSDAEPAVTENAEVPEAVDPRMPPFPADLKWKKDDEPPVNVAADEDEDETVIPKPDVVARVTNVSPIPPSPPNGAGRS